MLHPMIKEDDILWISPKEGGAHIVIYYDPNRHSSAYSDSHDFLKWLGFKVRRSDQYISGYAVDKCRYEQYDSHYRLPTIKPHILMLHDLWRAGKHPLSALDNLSCESALREWEEDTLERIL